MRKLLLKNVQVFPNKTQDLSVSANPVSAKGKFLSPLFYFFYATDLTLVKMHQASLLWSAKMYSYSVFCY